VEFNTEASSRKAMDGVIGNDLYVALPLLFLAVRRGYPRFPTLNPTVFLSKIRQIKL